MATADNTQDRLERFEPDEIPMDADGLIVDCMREFGRYTHLTKFPHLVDGLKAGQRRIIEALGTNTTNYIGMIGIIGQVVKRHGHGDGSIADTIYRMGEPWSHTFPLVDFKGSLGSYSEPVPAAPRYQEVRASQFAVDVYYEGINTKTFEMIPDIDQGWEPAYLIPKIPMVFLTGSFGIGVGFNNNFPPLSFTNLCKLTQEFIRRRQTFEGTGTLVPELDSWVLSATMVSAMARYLIPHFPSPGIIRNFDQVVDAYRQGNYTQPVMLDGIMRITPTALFLKALPPNRKFFDACEAVAVQMLDRNSFASANFARIHSGASGRSVSTDGQVDFDTVAANYAFHLKRGVRPFAVMNELKRQLQFTGYWRPNILGIDLDSNTKPYTPLQVLEIWYVARHRSIMADLRYTQNHLVTSIHRLRAQLTIRDHTDEVIAIIRGSVTEQDRITQLEKRFGLTIMQSKFLLQLPISSLSKFSQEELAARLHAVEQQLRDLREKFGTVDERMVNDIEALVAKYGKKAAPVTHSPTYKGALVLPDGVIQFWTDKDLADLLATWKDDNPKVVVYPEGKSYTIAVTPEGTVETSLTVDLPKDMPAIEFQVSKLAPRHTVVIRDGCIYRLEAMTYAAPEAGATVSHFYVGNRCTTIARNGRVEIIDTATIPLRRQVVAKGIKTDLVHVDGIYSDDLVIAHANPTEPNMIRLQRVRSGDQLLCSPLGELRILGMVKTGEPLLVSIPTWVLKRLRLGSVRIKNTAEAFPKCGDRAQLLLAKKSADTGHKLTKVPGLSMLQW